MTELKNDKRYIYFKGEIIPEEDAKISILSPAVQYGVNVFAGIRCYYNKKSNQLYAFRLEDHVERLLNSAKILRFNLDPKINFEYIKNNLINVIKANDFREDIYVRITLLLDGRGNWGSTEPIELIISPFPKARAFVDKDGLTACITTWERINDKALPPRVKAGGNYLNSRLGQLEAFTNGYDSAIFLNQEGKVAEGPGSCIFIIRKGKLITPPVTASILESITRQSVITISSNILNIDVIERPIDRTELYNADEIFLCGTAIEITPILCIDKICVNTKKVGKITNELRDLYFQIVRNTTTAHCQNEWLSAIY